jgi:hypothetical protein
LITVTARACAAQVMGVKIPAEYGSEECRKFLDNL